MSGLDATFKALSQSKSVAAEELWLESLASSRPYIRSQSFQAAGAGSPTQVQIAIIQRWRELESADKQVIGNNLVRFLPGLRACLNHSNDVIRANAFAIALSQQCFALIPDFVQLIEVTGQSYRASAGRVLIRLAEMLPRKHPLSAEDGKTATADFYRNQIIECLTKSMRRFHLHQRPEILAAFLMVAPLDNPVLKELLDQPKSTPVVKAAELLSDRNFVDVPDRLLIDCLNQSPAPRLIKTIWSTRRDLTFIRLWLTEIASSAGQACQRNLAELNQIDWLQGCEDWVADLTLVQQQGLFKLITQSAIDPAAQRSSLIELAKNGQQTLIADAIRALADDRTEEVDQLIVGLIHHPLVAVQVEVIRQLKTRDIPGVEPLLFDALAHEHPDVRSVAREAFSDYTIEAFLASYDSMESSERQKNGQIVKLVDANLIPKLHLELTHGFRFRKIRALEIISELELHEQIEEDLLALTESTDQGMRVEACHALGQCTSREAEIALNRAMTDKSVAVKEAALHSLQKIERNRSLDDTDSAETAMPVGAFPEATQ